MTHGEKPRVGWRLTKGQFLIGRERIAPLTFIDLSDQEPENRTLISRGHARLVVTDQSMRLGDDVQIGRVRLRVTVQ